MGGILSYSGIVTKVRAMEAGLLSKEDYEKIAALESVSEFISFLKGQKGYQTLFEGRDESSFHRNEIEELLNSSFYQAYASLYRFCGQEQRKGLELVFWRMETDWLKACLYRILSGKEGKTPESVLDFLGRHSQLAIGAVEEAKTVDAFLLALKDSPYEKPFSNLEEGELKPSIIGEKLDIYCFMRIWQKIEKDFHREDKRALKDVYGKQIDLLNILWIYRTKKYYSGGNTETVPTVIPVCYKLKKAQLKELIDSYTTEEFFQILKKTYYSASGEDKSIEQFYREHLESAYLENQRRYPYSMSGAYRFLYQKTREIARLTTALECIRYQLEDSLAMEYIMQE
jgi:V/A-type H+-transporting ATPase subunit C